MKRLIWSVMEFLFSNCVLFGLGIPLYQKAEGTITSTVANWFTFGIIVWTIFYSLVAISKWGTGLIDTRAISDFKKYGGWSGVLRASLASILNSPGTRAKAEEEAQERIDRVCYLGTVKYGFFHKLDYLYFHMGTLCLIVLMVNAEYIKFAVYYSLLEALYIYGVSLTKRARKDAKAIVAARRVQAEEMERKRQAQNVVVTSSVPTPRVRRVENSHLT